MEEQAHTQLAASSFASFKCERLRMEPAPVAGGHCCFSWCAACNHFASGIATSVECVLVLVPHVVAVFLTQQFFCRSDS